MCRDGWAALPSGATGLSAVCDVVFPDHTHLLFLVHFVGKIVVEKRGLLEDFYVGDFLMLDQV